MAVSMERDRPQGAVGGRLRGAWWGWLLPDPADRAARSALRLGILRILIVANTLFGIYYLSWRYLDSINWAFWPIALALLAAETYSFIDTALFAVMMWKLRERGEPPPPIEATVDVYITCYNEPVELVRDTVRAAKAMRYPHETYILDDGRNPEMLAMAVGEAVGYIIRTDEWEGRSRHAKAGNLNNAIFQTSGEFIMILDADQVPRPDTLDRVMGYFRDPKVSFVQTPQWFHNVPPGDPFGSQAPLFYGPIQQGKDGWNAAFFCGSNAVLRREALMQLGIAKYARELRERVPRTLKTADRILRSAERRMARAATDGAAARVALRRLRRAVADARRALRAGVPLQEVTWEFQRTADAVSREMVSDDLAKIWADLVDLPGFEAADDPDLASTLQALSSTGPALDRAAGRLASPLHAVEAVRDLVRDLDVTRADEAIPVMPMSTISVTEDMATAMRLHAMGWTSVYHHEILVHGLAPEDLRTALQQRLRWAQGTIQVLLRENPLRVPGLSLVQRLMYFATMWSYLSGFFGVVYLAAPVLYLFFGWQPVEAYSEAFIWHLVPYLIANQVLFRFVGWGVPTWRGQQYSLALFPLWIKAVTSAVGSVYFGRKLGFVVTPKTRQGGIHLSLVRPQLVAMGLLLVAAAWGLSRVALGQTDKPAAILVNVAWAVYDLVILSVVLDAVTYQPSDEDATVSTGTQAGAAMLRGRAAAGGAR